MKDKDMDLILSSDIEEMENNNIKVFEEIIFEELKKYSDNIIIESVDGYIKIKGNICKILKGFKFRTDPYTMNILKSRLKDIYKDSTYNVYYDYQVYSYGYHFRFCLYRDNNKTCFEDENDD